MSLYDIPIARSVPARYTFINQQEKISYDASTQTESSFDDLIRNAVLQALANIVQVPPVHAPAPLRLTAPVPKTQITNVKIREMIRAHGPYNEPHRCIAITQQGGRCKMSVKKTDGIFCHHHVHTEQVNKVDLDLRKECCVCLNHKHDLIYDGVCNEGVCNDCFNHLPTHKCPNCRTPYQT